jgi:hypothetical protein
MSEGGATPQRGTRAFRLCPRLCLDLCLKLCPTAVRSEPIWTYANSRLFADSSTTPARVVGRLRGPLVGWAVCSAAWTA